MRRLALFVLAACARPHVAPMTWPTLDAKLLADAAATFDFRLGLPVPLAITPDGAVLFRRTPPRAFAADLYELDTRTGAVRTLVTVDDLLGAGGEHLSDAEKARRERTRTATRGVVDIDVSDDGKTVMVPLGGMLYLVDRTTGARRAIDPGGDAYDAHLSPDGAQIAFVRDGDLYVIAPDHAARRLTHHPEGFAYGIADFAAQEELDRQRGFWWSPDGKQLVFQRSDDRAVDTIYVADALHNDRPPVPFKYPRAGRANATVDLGIIAASGGEPIWLPWDLATYPYLARVTWQRGAPLAIVVLSREQDKLAALALDGKNAWQPLIAETSQTWINVPRTGELGYEPGSPLWLPGGDFVWATEAPGAWVAERHGAHGATQRLTTPEFGLRKLIGLDGGDLIVEASATPTRIDVWRVPLAGGAPVRISGGDGVSTAYYDHGVLVIATALAAGGKRTVAIGKDGARHELPSVAERPSLSPTTSIETVELGGRTHYVAITRPRAFDRTRRYPVLLSVYGGPGVQTVLDARDAYVMDQWYADAGFIVVRADGRGTPGRGAAWERAIYQDLITVPLADQVAALQAVGARYHELDLARVGVFGWSFGGYFSVMADLLRPDVFACAVAGAPVTDWQLYDTAYTERYMRTPEHNPAGYASTSALTHAGKLARPLLILHGITDDNVHFAHTLALIEALYVAGKYADVITLSSTHMVPDPALKLARERVQIEFFRSHLAATSSR